MHSLYTRFVLWLIRPALRLHAARTTSATDELSGLTPNASRLVKARVLQGSTLELGPEDSQSLWIEAARSLESSPSTSAKSGRVPL